MNLKQAIIKVMTRDNLKKVINDREITTVDRRKRSSMARSVGKRRDIAPQYLLGFLKERQVKDVCQFLEIDDTGRKNALIEKLLTECKPKPRAKPGAKGGKEKSSGKKQQRTPKTKRRRKKSHKKETRPSGKKKEKKGKRKGRPDRGGQKKKGRGKQKGSPAPKPKDRPSKPTSPTATFTYSAEQKAVLNHRGSHLQIIACAGSGKTEVISRRTADLLSEGIEPDQIIAFTFTEKAAAGLKRRIENHVAKDHGRGRLDRLNHMFVGTIHSFCLNLLQEHVPAYAAFDVLDDHRLAALVDREYRRLGLKDLGISGRWSAIRNFLRSVDVVENELMNADQLEDGPFRECYERFCETLRRYKLLTYGQFISRAVEELQKPRVFRRVRDRLRHLIVDEYQDINPAQEALIGLLAKPPVQLCVVGDDDQAIYQWRGSNVENMLSFADRYPKVCSLSITGNYRSRKPIIGSANRFSHSIAPRLEKKMEPQRAEAGEAVRCWLAETPRHEAEVIADTIERLVRDGLTYGDIAILLRSVKTSGCPLAEEFEERGIPYTCGGRTGLFYEPTAQLIGKTFAWLVGARWKPTRYAEQEDVELRGLVEEYVVLFDLDKSATRKLKKHLRAWQREVQEPTGPANLVRSYYELLQILAVHSWDLSDRVVASRLGTLARFSELLVDFESMTRRARPIPEEDNRIRGGLDRGDWFYHRLHCYIQNYALGGYEGFDGEESYDFDAVQILTIHRSKGLEWPVVFVPALARTRFPSKNTGREQDWLLPRETFQAERYEGSEADERRLFYVAVTRARDYLYLSTFQRINRRSSASPFLTEVAKEKLQPMTTLPLPQASQSKADDKELPTIPFSDLASYHQCPHGFRLRGLLGFEPPIASEIGYGKAVHHVLRRVAEDTRANGKLPNAEDLETLFEEEFYLPYASDLLHEQMVEAARQLVGDYITRNSEDLSRIWEIERPFELHLDSASITGRADVILDHEGGQAGSMAILDYKTGMDSASQKLHEFQLAIYAAAALREGINVRGAYLHDLSRGERLVVSKALKAKNETVEKAEKIVDNIQRRHFPPKTGKHCRRCDVQLLCRHCQTGR